MGRCILHIDMDAFFASVEQRDRPELKGKPVIVGAPPDQRGVVSTCSYEARKFGVHSAMPSREAYRRCPQGIFLRPDMARYSEASRQVFEIFGRYSPLVEPVSIDEAFVDVTGAKLLFGDGEAIGKAIRAAIKKEVRITASVGVAKNMFLAKLGSDYAKPDGLFVVPNDRDGVIRFLGGLKVGALWGVGKVAGEALTSAGYRTVADVQKANPKALERLLGKGFAEQLLALAFGEDDRELVMESVDKSLSREYTFLTDCQDANEVRRVLTELAEDVGRRVRRHGFYAATGHLKLRWADFKTITRQAPFATPVCDDFTFREMALRLFNAEKLVQPVRLVGFGVSHFSDGPKEQLSLFGNDGAKDREKKERLCRAVDKISERFDDGTVHFGG